MESIGIMDHHHTSTSTYTTGRPWATAQAACELDPGSREAASVHRRAKAVATARQRGNDLFKASRFAEACAAYGEGLDKGEAGCAVLL